ncbi:MAG: DivIVA domain-containing protein, partial [Deltaproteobacteria bacterium]|nr:DivIVA domain-containing protein [Deltaproteobacteria bacterium]
MKLTPLEVASEQFSRRWRGYDRTEVDAFQRLVASRFEELTRENAGLREELEQARAVLGEHKERERGVQEALYAARQFGEEMRLQAQREADILRIEAELAGEQIKLEAERQLVLLQRELAELRQQRARLLVELRGLLESHLRMLDVQSGDLQLGAPAPAAAQAVLPSAAPRPASLLT